MPGTGEWEWEPGVGVAGVTEIIVLATGDGGGKVEGLGVLTVSSCKMWSVSVNDEPIISTS